jgi:hypothetical protein
MLSLSKLDSPVWKTRSSDFISKNTKIGTFGFFKLNIRMKKSLVRLPMHQGSLVPNARTHVSKTPDVRAIMGLQNICAGSAVNACKTCGHAATVQLQCSASTVNHSPGIVIVQG